MTEPNALITTEGEAAARPSETAVIRTLAEQYGVLPKQFYEIIKQTVMPASSSPSSLLAFLTVAKEYGLNPLTREIAAFEGQGGKIVPMLMIDGWLRKANEHPQMDGLATEEIKEAGKVIAVKATIYRKDRTRPIVAVEYLSECKRPTKPWDQMPIRMLTNKAIIQAIRRAFSISGVYDQDEAADVAANADSTAAAGTMSKLESLKERMAGASQGYKEVAAEVVKDEATSEKEQSGTEPQQAEGAAGGENLQQTTPSAAPEAEPPAKKRGRKPKPEPAPEPAGPEIGLGADGVAGDKTCYFCGKPWDGGLYALPNSQKANRCKACEAKMEAAKAEFARGLPGSSGDLPPPPAADPEPKRGPDKWDSLRGAALLEAAAAVCSKSLKTVRELRRLSTPEPKEDAIRDLCRQIEEGGAS